jgi:hypothetical protein
MSVYIMLVTVTMKEKKFAFELTPANLIKAAFAGDVGAIQEIVLIATIFTGFCNAVIASWKTTSKLGSIFDVGRCFLPHPYDEGSVIFPTTLLLGNPIAGLVASISGILMMTSSPQVITIVRQALMLPIVYWIARFGRNSKYGNKIFAFCALANIGTFIMTVFYYPFILAVCLTMGNKQFGFFPLVFYSFLARKLVTDGLVNFLRFWHKASPEEKRPMWLKNGWYSDKICPSRAEEKERWKGLWRGNRMYFNLYLVIISCFQVGIMVPDAAGYLLVTTFNDGEIRWTEFDWNVKRSVLGKAYGSFFGKGLRIPQFYWAEYFGNFDTILGHMALAFGIDLFLLVQNVLPQAGSTVGRGIAPVPV